MSKVRIAEYLDIELDSDTWHCHVCEHVLGPATESYKRGCLVAERAVTDIYPPVFPVDSAYTLSTDPDYGIFVEFYCPGCGTMIVNECLPAGYPPPNDLLPDLDALRTRSGAQEPEAARV
jgi:acetone carboxylase, gamma subunit